ncbi:MAG: T9SS type A sorting domain-containing protein [Firmicutes bacterium]|nr:T9SS type A sorting domain-containing protein [Bacillota bacterium]MCM1401935.1 T9SS type A sorting domain-containing protein [Bacteroides sp.]MCM1477821.1 T9SS type A sorting domain-containing protein [Bacteroides sp.]
MKRTIAVLSLVAMFFTCAMSLSAKYHSVTVHFKDKTSMSINLCEDLTVRFNDLEMTVMGSSLHKTVVIPKQNIHKFEHQTTAAIDNVATDASTPVFDNGNLSFSNLPAGSVVEVYDVAGRQVLSRQAQGEFTLNLASLTSGIYVVKVNNSTFKIAVK